MKMLNELRQEREAIEEAILTLVRLANGQGRRRGRPPGLDDCAEAEASGRSGPFGRPFLSEDEAANRPTPHPNSERSLLGRARAILNPIIRRAGRAFFAL